jgi:DNA-binding transcriptional ArsR family regulator
MSDITDIKPELASTEVEPKLLEAGADETEVVFDALASETTRQLLWDLYETPATPTEVADRAGTSLQNAHYHLDKLEAAGLVQDVGTRYSERGQAMTVYAPTSDPLVLAGRDRTARSIREHLPAMAGALALLAGVALAIQWVMPSGDMGSYGVVGPAGRSTGPPPPPVGTGSVTQFVNALTPGGLVALGGATVLAVWVAAAWLGER